MIVNSDDAKWGWMDEGLDNIMHTSQNEDRKKLFQMPNHPHRIEKSNPSRRGEPSKIVNYMSGESNYISTYHVLS